jgi:LacI family transcriptional regulator
MVMGRRLQPRAPAATLKQIAQRAGCAVSAVSTVLNGARGSTGVSAAVRQRIEQCAQELGYEANYHAQALRAGRAATIGLLLGPGAGPTVHARFFAPIMAGVEAGVRQAGSDLLLVGPSEAESELERGLRYCRQGRIDALVVPGLVYHGQMERIARADAPIAVALAQAPPGHPTVSIAEEPGIRQAMEHVAERRHREVIWLDLTVAGAERTPDRAAGVQALAATAGLACRTVTIPIGNPDKLLEIAGWVDAAHACFSAHLQAEAPPTAVIAYNELCALGAYAALAEAGLRVPEDVSVIGFDDITADVALPPMTVVSLQLREVGLAAAALALALASGAGAWQRLAGQIVSVPAQLVVRSSTGLAARKRTGRGRAVP